MNEYRPGGFQILPVVIKNLIIINVIVLLAQTFLGWGEGSWFEKTFALHYVESSLFHPWQLLTYQFMHGGFWHLAGNMFGLWMIGSLLENTWGAKRFLVFYIVCGIGAGLCQIAYGQYQLGGIAKDYQILTGDFNYSTFGDFAKEYHLGRYYSGMADLMANWANNPSSPIFTSKAREIADVITNSMINEPAVGASGSVFGILVAFGYLFPNMLIYLGFFYPIKAKWFVAGYFLIELYLGIQNNPGDNVAHAAHVGGGLVGFLIVYIWNKRDRTNFY